MKETKKLLAMMGEDDIIPQRGKTAAELAVDPEYIAKGERERAANSRPPLTKEQQLANSKAIIEDIDFRQENAALYKRFSS